MTTVEPLAQRLIELLRETVLGESDRDVDPGDPLGEEGIGLDSLGLVQFLTSVEKKFRVSVPIDVWSRIDTLTIDDLTATLRHALPDA